MLYAAKCYWPGVTERELEHVGIRAGCAAGPVESQDVMYVGSLLFAADDLVLCLFDARSRAAVKRVSEQAGIPCERVMESVWLSPSPTKQHEANQ
jgi:hypothetical protein